MKKTILTLTAIALLTPSTAMGTTLTQPSMNAESTFNNNYYSQLNTIVKINAVGVAKSSWFDKVLCSFGVLSRCSKHA